MSKKTRPTNAGLKGLFPNPPNAILAIPIATKRFFEEVFAMLNVPAKMQRLFFKGMEEQFNSPISSLDLATRKEKIKADKALLIYDEDDEVVSEKDIRHFLKGRPEIESMNAKGAGHNTIIRNKAVIETVVRFLAD